jgi:hypothetical protein
MAETESICIMSNKARPSLLAGTTYQKLPQFFGISRAESECTLLLEFDCSALSATNTLFECTLLKPTRLLVRGRLAHGKPSYRRIKSDTPINDMRSDLQNGRCCPSPSIDPNTNPRRVKPQLTHEIHDSALTLSTSQTHSDLVSQDLRGIFSHHLTIQRVSPRFRRRESRPQPMLRSRCTTNMLTNLQVLWAG